MRFKAWWKSTTSSADSTEPSVASNERPQPAGPPFGYAADHPITTSAEDRFGRWPFASRLAETLAMRTDPSSVVIGLYGPWGDGKTSTLHLMEQALRSYPNVISVRFNPWYFGSQESLLRGFFQTLAEALGKKLSNHKEAVGEILKKYGGLLSVASLTVGGVVSISPGEAAKGLGEGLSTVELEQLRARLEGILKETNARVVVMIDDIDRLDRDEIHAIFKLVKLSAGFEQTSYVLAFDDDIVSESLGARYGAGNARAGRSFLEKIVQVPLHLPAADDVELRALTFNGVDAALTSASIQLSKGDVEIFARRFVDGLEPRLQTPRQSKLYVNAITFALPLLKDEVNTVDQMLLEGIRVFYPKLYAVIRDNPRRFLTQPNDGNGSTAERQEVDLAVDRALSDLTAQDALSVKEQLLEPLFPRYGTIGYGSEWDATWAKSKHICVEEYFARYFAYNVPPGDISDVEAEAFIERAATLSPDEMKTTVEAIAARRGTTKLIKKLRDKEAEIAPSFAGPVALAIVRNGAYLPREQQILLPDWTFMQVGILASRMIGRLPAGEQRSNLAKQIVGEAVPLALAFQCFRWMRKSNDDKKPDRLLSIQEEEEVAAILADRIQSTASEGPLFVSQDEDTPALLWMWDKYGDKATLKEHLEQHIRADPIAAPRFLEVFLSRSWGVESGLSSPSDFDRANYNSVSAYVDPELILQQLRKIFGSALDHPEYYHPESTPLDEVVAHQFAVIHRAVVSGEGDQHFASESEAEN